VGRREWCHFSGCVLAVRVIGFKKKVTAHKRRLCILRA
jgi:hypothetical protein